MSGAAPQSPASRDYEDRVFARWNSKLENRSSLSAPAVVAVGAVDAACLVAPKPKRIIPGYGWMDQGLREVVAPASPGAIGR